ncbi:MAG: hypothetical protein LBL40_01245 [Coxiellaceae bacterium]|jgi:hypothetical protein|nr:hypothetical protein [Coxiellaceae bacterium]
MQILFLILLLIANNANAACPVCVVMVGAGVGLTQYLGVDDVISGLWIGGIIISLITLTNKICDQCNLRFYGYKFVISLLFYVIMLLSLYYGEIIGHDLNKWKGIDKIILGIALGSVFFFCGIIWHRYLKKKNNGKVYLPFQRVVLPITPLIVLSVVFLCFDQ